MDLNTILHVRLDKRIRKQLEEMSKASGLALSTYVRLILDQASRTPYRLKKGKVL